jgi:Leucine-rich repeat (LRR) protein
LTRDVRDVKRLYLSGELASFLPGAFRLFVRSVTLFSFFLPPISEQLTNADYWAGNPLKDDFLVEPCYNLVYLELAACRLTALPEGMARLVPNLRVLNLNYNFLEDVRPLQGLTRLQKLTIIGSRLKNTKPLIRLLQQMPDAEMLDFRCVWVLH